MTSFTRTLRARLHCAEFEVTAAFRDTDPMVISLHFGESERWVIDREVLRRGLMLRTCITKRQPNARPVKLAFDAIALWSVISTAERLIPYASIDVAGALADYLAAVIR